MRKYIFGFITVIAFAACTTGEEHTATTALSKDGSFFNGSWTYRSLLNDTAWQMDFDSLEFAAAIIDLKTTGKDSLTGLIYWAQHPYQGLKLSGKWYYQDTVACYMLTGIGDSSLGTPGWQYEYQGYLVPHWSFGVNQATVLAGSVARAKPHSGEPAGVVASTYMVRRGM
ncbi:MAG: hypothetical protein JST86_13650 [Bacteroidetes bacterium]|nr:hypothetical protein [Bacteroidota bacterium]